MLANWLTVIVLVCFMVKFQRFIERTALAPSYLSHLGEYRRFAVGSWLAGHNTAQLIRRYLI
jgi:hypothetical protein